MRGAVVSVALAAGVSGASAEPAQPLRIASVFATKGGWTIGSNDTVKGCLAASTYGDGTTIWFGIDSEKNGFIAFTNPAWRSIETARDYKIMLRAGATNWSGNFAGIERNNEKGVILFGMKTQFLSDFASAGQLGVFLDGASVTRVRLNGSSAALNAVMECAGRSNDNSAERQEGAASQSPRNESKNGSSASAGTGFFVSKAGSVLTNFHVVRGCRDIWIIPSDSSKLGASLVAKDETNDLALLASGAKPGSVPAFNSRPRVGENIFVYGFPLTSILATTGNFTQGNVTATAGLNDDTRMLQISAPVQPGNSGGPVLDAKGNVEAVLVSKLNALRIAKITDDIPQNVNFAIKASIATNFLESNNLSPNTALSDKIYDGPALAELARTFTVRVVCK